MTFSGTADVSALYRQQKAHTGTSALSTNTIEQFRCVQMPEPVVRGQTGLNEPSKVAGLRQRWGAKRLGSQSISAAGRAQELPVFSQNIQIPIPLRGWFRLWLRVCPMSKRLAMIAQFNLAWCFSVGDHHLAHTLCRWRCSAAPALCSPAC